MSKVEVPNDAFNQAVQECLNRLDPVEQETFRATFATPEALFEQVRQLEQTNQQKDKTKTRKLIRRLNMALKDMEIFFTALDSGVAFGTPFAGIAYGALRGTIVLAARQTKFFDIVVDTLELISVDLPHYHDYATTVYTQSTAMQRALAEVYQDIFAVCLVVRRAFKTSKGEDRNMLSTMFGPFQTELEQITDRLAKRREIVEREAKHADRLANLHELGSSARERVEQQEERTKQQQERDKQEKERQTQTEYRKADQEQEKKAQQAEKRRKFMKLLDAADCSDKHFKTLKVYTRPECWLLEHSQFKEWYDKESGLVWCYSKPGAGKTVLMSVVIDYLMKQYRSDPEVAVAWFYCEGDDRRKRESTVVLASLLAQLMDDGDPDSPEKMAIVDGHSNEMSVYALDLPSLFSSVLDIYKKAYIVVDGIDECEPDQQEKLCESLLKLSQSCNLVVTSRRDQEHISTVFKDAATICILPEHVRGDICHFITTEVEQIKKLGKKSAALKADIVDTLLDSSDGMMLWVKLQLEHICTRRTDRDIRIALKELPRGLHETYSRVLEKISDSQLALRSLQWVLYAMQPVTIEQLAEAIAIEDMDDEWDPSRVVEDPMSLLFECGSLLYCSERFLSWGTDRMVVVSFIHTSVADFLRESPTVMTPNSFFHPMESAHASLASDCLKYLIMKCKRQHDLLQIIRRPEYKEPSFAVYAISAWEQHLKMLKTIDDDMIQSFRDFCLIPEVLKEYGGGSALHVALFLDLPLIADVLVDDNDLDLWCLDDAKHSLLHRAALGNLKALTRIVERMSHSMIPTVIDIAPVAEPQSAHLVEPSASAESGAENEEAKTEDEANKSENNPDSPPSDPEAPKDGEHADAGPGIKKPEQNLVAYINFPDLTESTALHYAAYSGVFEAVQLLVEHKANLAAVDNRKTTALHWAAASLKPDACRSLTFLLDHGAELEAKDYNNGTALHWASDKAKLEILLDHGSDINATGLSDLTALHLAAKKGPRALDCVSLLLERNANANALDTQKKSPLHYAAGQFGTSRIVSLLLERQADVDAEDIDGNTPLHFAASFDIETVKLLVQGKAKINVANARKRTPLHNAAFEYSNQAILKYLIEEGADMEMTDETERTALHDACSTDFENAKVLIEAGANVKALDKSLCAPQHFAASLPAGLNTLKLLQEKGANLHILDSRDWNVLHIGASTGGYTMVEYLITEVGIDVRTVDDQNATALHYASYSGILDSVKLLVEKEADIHATDNTKKTPLHWACQKNGAQDVVQYLVDQQADLNAADDNKMTPLHLAAQAASSESIEVLLKAGADASRRDNQQCTALHLASRKPEGAPSVKALLEDVKPEVISAVDNVGNTALHFAAVFTSLDTVKLFKERGADLLVKNDQKASILHWAAGSHTVGSEKVIEFLIQAGCALEDLDEQGWSPLHWAAMFGSVAGLRCLLDHKCDVAVRNRQGNTPLHLATSRSPVPFELVELLLKEGGSDPNATGEDGQTPLHFAVKHSGSLSIVELLVKYGADINALDAFNALPLHQASANDPKTAKFLVEQGSKLDICDSSKRSVLHHAKFSETIQLLIEKGVDPNLTDKQRSTVLHWTADRAGTHDSVKYLVEHGAQTNLIDQFGCTPLHLAAYGGEPESVRYLAEHGETNIEMLDQHQCTPLFLASKNPVGFEAMKILIEKGARLNLVDEHQSTPLHWTICHEKLDPVKFMVDHGAELNVSDRLGVTPLHIASTRSNLFEIAKFLIEREADVNAADDEGSRPIHYSAYSFEAHDTVKFLIEHGVDIEARDVHDSTPLLLASRSPRGRPSLELLIKHGAKVTVHDKNLCTALHWAAFYCDYKVVEVLLKSGANVNAQDVQKCTALHLAYGKQRVFRLLLENGADVNLRDSKNQTAVDYALFYDSFDVKKMLEELNISYNFSEERSTTSLTWIPAFSVVAPPLPSGPPSSPTHTSVGDRNDDNKHPANHLRVDLPSEPKEAEQSPVESKEGEESATERNSGEESPADTEIIDKDLVIIDPQLGDDLEVISPPSPEEEESISITVEGPSTIQPDATDPTMVPLPDSPVDLSINLDLDDRPKAPLHYANYYWHGITHRQFEVRPNVVDDDDPIIVHTPLEPIAEVDEEHIEAVMLDPQENSQDSINSDDLVLTVSTIS